MKKIRQHAILLILTITFALVICGAVSATSYTDIYVSPTGNDSYDGGDPLHPAQTIGHALEVTQDSGSTVHLANGVYSGTGNTNITLSKSMTITGESQKGTIINGSDSNWIFHIDANVYVTIQNLTFANGTAHEGGALYNNGHLTVISCTFTGNHASGGGVIHDEAYTTFTNCIFDHNSAYQGGAIYNCCGTETITGCTFTGNTANYGGAIWNEAPSTLTIYLSRIVGNTASSGGSAICHSSGSVTAENNWWGSNNPDFASLISGEVDYTKWIYMTISVNPTTIKNGETSLITVSFNNLCDGDNITSLDPATGHIPDGTLVTFCTDLGSVDCKTIEKPTVDGVATATLFADEIAGIAHLNATLDSQTLSTEVTISPKSGLYLTVTPSKANPAVGDTVVYTLKVGNKGPDTAKDVVMTYVVPEGLEFAGANVDVGTYTYDPATRTITWIIGDVPVGDPYMWLSLRVAQSGNYLINPVLSTSTYDPTLNVDTQSITVNAATKVGAKTIPLQETGLPIAGLVLAILAVFGGLATSKRK